MAKVDQSTNIASEQLNANMKGHKGSSGTETAPEQAWLGAKDGTIHVHILRAENLPTLDFGKRQEPVVQVELENSGSRNVGMTDPVPQGGAAPKWTDDLNNHIELHYDASIVRKSIVLTVRAYADALCEDLIGTGQVDITTIVRTQESEPTDYKVRLRESLLDSTTQGDVYLNVAFGPPMRRNLRVFQKIAKLFTYRDQLVRAIMDGIFRLIGPIIAKYQLNFDIQEFAYRNPKFSVAIAAILGIVAAGASALFLLFAIPTAILATITFPLWIFPFLGIALVTSPLWVPIVLLVGLFLSCIAFCCAGLGVTSPGVRRKGVWWTTQFKQTDVGRRVVYDKGD
jgi:hypothetical protein